MVQYLRKLLENYFQNSEFKLLKYKKGRKREENHVTKRMIYNLLRLFTPANSFIHNLVLSVYQNCPIFLQ